MSTRDEAPAATRPDPAWAQRVLASEPSVGDVRLVCIDGPSGSGKTTLASWFAGVLSPVVGEVPVVHGDEVYEGWPVVAGATDRVAALDLLGERLDGWLLDPWRQGRAGTHPRWDWRADRWGGSVAVPPAGVVVLEGVGLGGRALRGHAVLTAWVDADDGARLARVLARDGDGIRHEMLAWRTDEAAWHRHDGTEGGADVRLRT